MSGGGYSAESAGAVAERSLSRGAHGGSSLTQDLDSNHWQRAVAMLIDLKEGLTAGRLHKHHKRQAVRFMVNGTQPVAVNGRYPDPMTLSQRIADLSGQGAECDVQLLAALKREQREVQAARALAVAMSGRKRRPPQLTAVDRRLRGKPCVRCGATLRLGEQVYLDRDFGSAWHVAGACA